MSALQKFVFTPAGASSVTLAVAAARAGAIGVVDAEFDPDAASTARRLAQMAGERSGSLGLRLGPADDALWQVIDDRQDIGWLIVDMPMLGSQPDALARARRKGVKVLLELSSAEPLDKAWAAALDGLLLKGNEAGGIVGDVATFILLQWWRGRTTLPLHVRGGVSPLVAAACAAVGVQDRKSVV